MLAKAVTISLLLTGMATGSSLASDAFISRDKKKQVLDIELELSQEKVLKGADGQVAIALTIHGDTIVAKTDREMPAVDLVVVLDRSGSMQGQKIHDARQAILQVMERMGKQDMMAVISYSNGARLDSPLVFLDHRNLGRLASAVRQIQPGGGTNLGSGLQYGIETLLYDDGGYRQRKVILISDGLANQGITSLRGLAHMAEQSMEQNFTISTVGVGYDFNEMVMTTIADHGAGNYYFLENPRAFANIFEKEFENAREVIASSIEIRIPVQRGMKLIDAGGYPLIRKDGYVTIRPGDVLSGQDRKIYLTYEVDTSKEEQYRFDKIDIQYVNKEKRYGRFSESELEVSCVADEKAVIASIDKKVWSEKVIGKDYNRLKSEVAKAVKEGRKEAALASIEEYEARNSLINEEIGSSDVARNLDSEVQELKETVTDTFTGAPAAVAEKQKVQSKVLQYDSYRKLRNKQ